MMTLVCSTSQKDKNNLRPVLTTLYPHNDEVSTQRIDIGSIVLPDKNACQASFNRVIEEPPSRTFCFEQQRLQLLGRDQIEKLRDNGPQIEIDPEDPRVERVILKNKAQITGELDLVAYWSKSLKINSVVSIVWGAVLVLFAMAYTFCIALYASEKFGVSVIPMCLNVASSVWMFVFSFFASGVWVENKANSPVFRSLFILGVASILAFSLQLGIMFFLESIPDLISRSNNLTETGKAEISQEKRADSFYSLSYLITLGACILNCTLFVLSLVFSHLLRRHLRLKEAYELRYRTLPLGYQIYSENQRVADIFV